MRELAHLDATDLAELVQKKEVQPIELVDACIARIESVNPELNAVVHRMYESARATAKGALPKGPFTGVPFLLKDILAFCAGEPMRAGSGMLADYVPDHDTELVLRFRRAGLIFVGKTSTPELGLLPTTEPRIFGATKNPWNLAHSTGGSSGGSAAMVASGCLPMAHANDGGGSIRIPASCCGVFGLKPTRARVPLGPDYGEVLHGYVVEHAVTRSVRDSARLLDAIEGPEIGDPYWAPPKQRPYAEEVARDPGRLKIAFTTRASTGVPVHPEVVAAVEDTAKLLESLGHTVVEGAPDFDAIEMVQAFTAIWAVGTATDVAGIERLLGKTFGADDMEPLTWALAEMGRTVPVALHNLMLARLQVISRAFSRFLAGYDAWLTPTLAAPPTPLGFFDAPADNPLQPMMRSAEYCPFTPLANFTGLPAMSVPLSLSSAGLPIGSHFFGRFGDEGLLFRLAAQLERARPWASKRPPVFSA
jgi:amidase